jgi:hypothetical protein
VVRLKAELALNLLAGCLEALLLARLVLQLLAGRPSNAGIAAVITATSPVVGLLAALDSGQPAFGATLELSTLACCLVVPVLYVIAQRMIRCRR